MAGFVNIKVQCIIGINPIIDNISITEETRTGGNSCNKKHRKKRLYVGNPAKFIR